MKLKGIFLSFIILLSFVSMAHAAPPINYNQELASDMALRGALFTDGSATGFYAWVEDGDIHITSDIHQTKTIKIKYTALSARVQDFNGFSVTAIHIADDGTRTSTIIPLVADFQGFAYATFDFSEIVIDGATGTFSVTCLNQTYSSVCNLGQTFNGSRVKSFQGTITDDGTKANPYDINTTGLVGWWRGDGNALDSSENNNNGTLYGDTTYGNGKYDQGFAFDGTGDYVSIADIDLTNFSIGGYVNFTNSSAIDAYIIGKFGSYGIYRSPSNNLLYLRSFGLSDSYVEGSTTILNDRTINFYVTYDGGYVRHYYNGVLDRSQVVTGTLTNSANNLVLGGYSSSLNFITGMVDDVRIYNRTLSATEIKQQYLDHLEQLKVKSNANATYSSFWNGTGNNPLGIPFAPLEAIANLSYSFPSSVVQSGVTIYDYRNSTQFDITTTLTTGNDIYNVSETASSGVYNLNLTFNPLNSGSYYINWTTINSVLLNADFTDTAILISNETNATLALQTLPSFNISTGYMAAGTTKSFNITMGYYYPPTSLAITENGTTYLNLSWVGDARASTYSVYKNSVFVDNTTNLYYNYTGLTADTEYTLEVSYWNTSRETEKTTLIVTTDSEPTYNVSGYILTNESIPISSATVSISGYPSVSSNVTGYYIISGVENGTYTAVSSKSGYVTNSSAEFVVSVADVTNVNVTLMAQEPFTGGEMPKMPYQIFIMLIIVDILLIYYSFTTKDTDYYTDIITAFIALFVSLIIAYNSLIGVYVLYPLATAVQYDSNESTVIGMIFGVTGLLMLIFGVTKILDIIHTEAEKI